MLVDITVTQVAPGATHLTAVTGTLTDARGSSQITLSGGIPVIASTSLSARFGDLTDLIIIPPIDANLSTPDCVIWPVVDGVDLHHVLHIDASVDRLMFPSPAVTVGRQHVSLGIAYRDAVDRNLDNLPLKVTGLKAAREYRFAVYSSAGFGNAGNPVTPLRIIGLGDLLNAEALEEVARIPYQGSFADQVPGFEPFRGEHGLRGGVLSAASWTSLPGGPAQTDVKIYRFFREAINRVATSAQGIFVLSNQNAVGGAQGNVADEYEDLGFDYGSGVRGDDYLRIMEAGIRPHANLGFWGVRVEDTILPGDGQWGTPIFPGVNPYAYGLVQPQRPDSNLYYALPKSPFPIAVRGQKVAFFLVANGTAIPANGVSVAVGGISVQVGQ